MRTYNAIIKLFNKGEEINYKGYQSQVIDFKVDKNTIYNDIDIEFAKNCENSIIIDEVCVFFENGLVYKDKLTKPFELTIHMKPVFYKGNLTIKEE